MPRRWSALAASLILATCTSTTTGPGGPTAQVRLLNGGAGGALDVVADGVVVISGVPAGAASEYADVSAAATSLVVRYSGTGAALSTLAAQFDAGARYAVVASATMANVQRQSGDTGLARPDRANIRIVNIAPVPSSDSGSFPAPVYLDVHITAPGIALDGRQAELSMNAAVPSYSTLMYFDPGTWVVRFRRVSDGVVVATSPAVTIGDGEIRAVFLERRSDGTYQVTVVTET